MAISDNYNSLTFGGVNSLDYGIFISGPGVYNAPTRAVEFVDVPGRNGAIEIDQGHWNNIEVTYNAGMFADDQADFGEKMNEFRNAIVSQVGYQRLTDTYNPDHYRLGIYASGIEVNPVRYNDAGEFTLTFNCKPQRYLTSGETPISVTSGDTLTNPTLYEASPLIGAYGYGNIDVNGYAITLIDEDVGTIQLAGGQTLPPTDSVRFDGALMDFGDSMTMENASVGYTVSASNSDNYVSAAEISSYSTSTFPITGAPRLRTSQGMFGELTCRIFLDGFSLSYLENQNRTWNANVNVRHTVKSKSTEEVVINVTKSIPIRLFLRTGHPELSDYLRVVIMTISDGGGIRISKNISTGYKPLIGESTQSVLGNPTYIDTEVGEVYKMRNGRIENLNSYVQLESDLPNLATGDNTVTYDNTITGLEVTPRWWEL